MNKKKVHLIIHGFALLHVVLCISCRYVGIPDSLILTLATMAMVVLLCREEDLSIEFTAITIILANILGFILGNIGAASARSLNTYIFIIENENTAINYVTLPNPDGPKTYYDMQGRKLETPHGLCIERSSDGRSRTILGLTRTNKSPMCTHIPINIARTSSQHTLVELFSKEQLFVPVRQTLDVIGRRMFRHP